MKKSVLIYLVTFLYFSSCNDEVKKETDTKSEDIKLSKDTFETKSHSVHIKVVNDTSLYKPKISGLLFCNDSKDTIYVISLKSFSQPNDKIRLLLYQNIHLSEADIKDDWGSTSPFFYSADFDTIRLIPEENRFLNLPLSYFSKKLIDSLEFSYKYFKNNISDTSEVRCLDGFVYKVNQYRTYKRKRW